MRLLFIGLAASLLILYSPYLLYILLDRANEFEERIQEEVVASLSTVMDKPWRFLVPVVMVALLLEIAYFVSVWKVFDLVAYRGLTLGFIFFEVIHLGRTLWYLPGCASGQVKIDKLVIWPLERTVALMFSIHAILGFLLLIWP